MAKKVVEAQSLVEKAKSLQKEGVIVEVPQAVVEEAAGGPVAVASSSNDKSSYELRGPTPEREPSPKWADVHDDPGGDAY
eukprot:3639473-Karenia_brevis.AAC.1